MEKAIKQLKKLEKLGSDMRLAAESWQKPWQSLLSTMLSARTRDEVTIAVCNVLFRRYKSADAVAKANTGAIRKIIKPVNFYKTKAKNIMECAKLLAEKSRGTPPHDFRKLT